LRELLLQGGVSALFGIFVNPGVHPVPGVQGYRGDAVPSGDEESLRFTAGFEIAACIEEGMPKITELHVVLGQQHAGYAFPLDNVVLPGLQSNPVQGGVTEGVVAKLEAVVEPHPQRLDSLVDFAEFVELLFIDESDGRDFLVAERGQQLCRHLRDGGRIHRIGGASRQIVDRDGDLPVGKLLRGEG
jgi:hypothetical protein